MTKAEYEHRMNIHERNYASVMAQMLEDTEKLKRANPDLTDFYLSARVSNFIDEIALDSGRIQDILSGKGPYDKGSVFKRIKKALGRIHV